MYQSIAYKYYILTKMMSISYFIDNNKKEKKIKLFKDLLPPHSLSYYIICFLSLYIELVIG